MTHPTSGSVRAATKIYIIAIHAPAALLEEDLDACDRAEIKKLAEIIDRETGASSWAAEKEAIMTAHHITYDLELDAEGSGYEVPAEPEPQFFSTLGEAVAFSLQLSLDHEMK